MNKLLELRNINKTFKTSEGQSLLVLDKINFTMNKGEIVALIGKSGSGKSTLLRIAAGLVSPSNGDVIYCNQVVNEPVPGIAMVFQSFALMPWLSVLENVELGLEAQGIPSKERRTRALKAIDTIGLDGFESAYPKELSGGMRQRVGFARALVTEPQLLIMDEPFSALDILTAENLRGDLLDLWHDGQTKIQGILCVTHDIEESILIADRIIIFDSNPGRIQAEINVNLPFPRNHESKEFKLLLEKIYTHMTGNRIKPKSRWQLHGNQEQPDVSYRVPEVDISELIGLLETMGAENISGKINLPELADDMHLDVDSIFPLIEVLDMLCFAKIKDGEINILPAGKKFAAADILERKKLFAERLSANVPLAAYIKNMLHSSSNKKVSEDNILTVLENYFSEEEADRILRTIIDWGRYAEIFAYDYDSGVLSLENPQ